jgi:uncharacterized protein
MNCPKCKSAMELVPVRDLAVDRCTACKGLWFDLQEHEEVKAAASEIDIGSADVGKRFNEVDKIDCPVCPSSRLLRMVDAKQPHIWFESCPTCYGRFYDAGEFRDFAKFDFSDIKKWFRIRART